MEFVKLNGWIEKGSDFISIDIKNGDTNNCIGDQVWISECGNKMEIYAHSYSDVLQEIADVIFFNFLIFFIMKRPFPENYSYTETNHLHSAKYDRDMILYCNYLESELQSKYPFDVAYVRNKLNPIVNLIAMIEYGLVKGKIEVHDLVLQEIEKVKNSVKYLAINDSL